MADPLRDVECKFFFVAGPTESVATNKVNYAIYAMNVAAPEIWVTGPKSTRFIHLYHGDGPADKNAEPMFMWSRDGIGNLAYYSWKALTHFYIYHQFYDSYKNT